MVAMFKVRLDFKGVSIEVITEKVATISRLY
jgi:hypothetical protein